MFSRVWLSKTISMICLYRLVYPPGESSSNNFSCKPILSTTLHLSPAFHHNNGKLAGSRIQTRNMFLYLAEYFNILYILYYMRLYPEDNRTESDMDIKILWIYYHKQDSISPKIVPLIPELLSLFLFIIGKEP